MLLKDLDNDQYGSNYDPEIFNPQLALDYVNNKQEEHIKNQAKNQSQIANKANPVESKTQALKRTLWDTQTVCFYKNSKLEETNGINSFLGQT